VDTQVEVLQAQPLMDQVTRQVGPAALTVAEVGQTNVITVGAESSDPKTAAAAPNALLNLYIAQSTNSELGGFIPTCVGQTLTPNGAIIA